MKYLPIVQLFPVKTFFSRMIQKDKYIKNYLSLVVNDLLHHFGFIGATELKLNSSQTTGAIPWGAGALSLNKRSALGKKHSIVYVYKDKGIYIEILKHGKVESEVSNFLASCITKDAEITLLDLGGNNGLISAQILQKTKTSLQVVIVEPILELCQIANLNLDQYSHMHQIKILNSVLVSNNNEKVSDFFVDSFSIGNSSLLIDVVPVLRRVKRIIRTLGPVGFEASVDSKSRLLVKSDLQGYDIIFLVSLSDLFWNRIDALCVEIFPTALMKKEILDVFLFRIENFSQIFWGYPNKLIRTTPDEIKGFILDRNKHLIPEKNLLMRR